MFNSFKKSLRNKLLILFMLIGFVPFLTLLAYTIFLSETKIVNKIILEQTDRTRNVQRLIDKHIHSLIKEVDFLSSLDVMDDLLLKDIDKRIARLLIQKANDLNLDAQFMVLDENSIIVASSEKEQIQEKIKFTHFKEPKSEIILKENHLFIFSTITASFNKKRNLGFLVLKYNLQNLDSYLIHQESIHSYIVNPKNKLHIGKDLSLNIDFNSQNNYIINGTHVIIYEKLYSILDDLYIVYAVDKAVALEFLYDFISFMLYISLLIFIAVIYISFSQSKNIVKPIEKLTSITNKISTTQDYSTRLETQSLDEIGILTRSFNDMISTTSSALGELEKENKLRLQRFTQLIDIFNTIIQTKTENECINTSITEIKKLTKSNDLSFYKHRNTMNAKKTTDLYVTDFEHNKKVYFGSIELEIEKFKDTNEENFYNSISSMISLQLDRIRLIQRTMSASQAKSAFISNMSHELRTPLNSIIGFAQYMISYEKLSEDQLDTIGNIESSGQYLLGMINEILDIAKIEAGKMEVFIEKIDIIILLQNIQDMLEPLASEKNLELHFNTRKFKDLHIDIDRKIFQQILINIISNAIKFTEEGSIELNLSETKEEIKITIVDTGIGISKEDLEKLFHDFTQVQNSMQKKYKGTGLGLSFSKKMAKLLNGDITLTSDGLGHGSSCTFTLKKGK